MRCRNEIAPTIGKSYGATGNHKCLDGHPNIATLATAKDQIKCLGDNLIKAYQAGDRDAAIRHQAAMLEAIRHQDPAKQVERFSQIDRAIAETDEFYFLICGERDRARLDGAQ